MNKKGLSYYREVPDDFKDQQMKSEKLRQMEPKKSIPIEKIIMIDEINATDRKTNKKFYKDPAHKSDSEKEWNEIYNLFVNRSRAQHMWQQTTSAEGSEAHEVASPERKGVQTPGAGQLPRPPPLGKVGKPQGKSFVSRLLG